MGWDGLGRRGGPWWQAWGLGALGGRGEDSKLRMSLMKLVFLVFIRTIIFPILKNYFFRENIFQNIPVGSFFRKRVTILYIM